MGKITEDMVFTGSVSLTSEFYPPDGSIAGAKISSDVANRIPATKLESQFSVSEELYAEGTAIVALASKLIHIVSGATGEVVDIEAIITTQATGADRTVTVDLEKSTAAGAFATILATTVDITNTTVIRTPVAGVISTADLVDGDILRLVVTVAGVAGAQAEGLLVTVTLREDPA